MLGMLGSFAMFWFSEEIKKSNKCIRVTNSLDSGQAWNFIVSDMGPNCLQGLSAGDKNLSLFKAVCSLFNHTATGQASNSRKNPT